jgi:hypothetical protein
VTFCSTSNVSRVTNKLRSRRLLSIGWIVAEHFYDFKYG